MKLGTLFVAITVAVVGASFAWYQAEPWTLTFIDDGPYRSVPFEEEVAELPLHSRLELRRLGHTHYILESRLLPGGDQSVLVLSRPGQTAIWRRLPVKPDGELGPVELRRSSLTWYGGWRVRIKPANQEGGNLYLGPRGGFRFFNHSW